MDGGELQAQGTLSFLSVRGTEETVRTKEFPPPKALLANERTFLHWMGLALILGGFSIAMLNFASKSSSLVPAVLFASLSCAMMIYSLFRYLGHYAHSHP